MRNHRICTELLRNLIPKCRNLRIGRRCRGRWLSSNRNSSRNVVRRVGGKTQSAEPRPCRGQIFPAGGDDRPFLGWFWCSPPLRWTTKGHGSLPMPANKVALGRHRQRQQPEHALQPTKLLKAVCFLDALTLGDGEDPPIRRSARKTPGGQPVIPENSGAPAQWPRAQKRFKGERIVNFKPHSRACAAIIHARMICSASVGGVQVRSRGRRGCRQGLERQIELCGGEKTKGWRGVPASRHKE